MSIQRWDAKGRVHEASQGGFVRYGDHVAEVAERDGQVRDMEAVIAMQRADVKRLTADLAAARAERDGLAKALRTVHEYSNQYVVSETARAALAALPPKEDDDA